MTHPAQHSWDAMHIVYYCTIKYLTITVIIHVLRSIYTFSGGELHLAKVSNGGAVASLRQRLRPRLQVFYFLKLFKNFASVRLLPTSVFLNCRTVQKVRLVNVTEDCSQQREYCQYNFRFRPRWKTKGTIKSLYQDPGAHPTNSHLSKEPRTGRRQKISCKHASCSSS